LIGMLVLFGHFSQGQRTARVWFGPFPVYAKVAFLALYYRRTKFSYRVTNKTDTGKQKVRLVNSQISFVAIGYFGQVYHLLRRGITRMFWLRLFWAVAVTYWFWLVVKMGISPKKTSPKLYPKARSAVTPP
jgi:hypothetical protein